MINKKLVFTFNDGSTLERDLSPVERDAPLGAGANHEYYLNIAVQSCSMGVLETETQSKMYAKVLPPSSIKSIEIIFTDTNKQAEA